jgi:hypothetical protein
MTRLARRSSHNILPWTAQHFQALDKPRKALTGELRFTQNPCLAVHVIDLVELTI